MKLHKAFVYEPQDDAVMANTTPKEGHRFIYLDVSMRNIGTQTLDGGMLLVALKVTDKNGTEYKKPAMALASYASENPEGTNSEEYDALWAKYAPNEFHREIVYAVEVPITVKELILKMPVDQKRKEWKEISFSI